MVWFRYDFKLSEKGTFLISCQAEMSVSSDYNGSLNILHVLVQIYSRKEIKPVCTLDNVRIFR